MTETDILQAISVNLLRLASWYHQAPKENVALCERYLEQSKQLSRQVSALAAQPYLQQLRSLKLESTDRHTAERLLTLGVILQHPENLLLRKTLS